jgi:hypothetical protein
LSRDGIIVRATVASIKALCLNNDVDADNVMAFDSTDNRQQAFFFQDLEMTPKSSGYYTRVVANAVADCYLRGDSVDSKLQVQEDKLVQLGDYQGLMDYFHSDFNMVTTGEELYGMIFKSEPRVIITDESGTDGTTLEDIDKPNLADELKYRIQQHRNGESTPFGVYQSSVDNRWYAYVMHKSTYFCLGWHDTKDEALAAHNRQASTLDNCYFTNVKKEAPQKKRKRIGK